MVAHASTSLTDTPRLLTQLSRGLVGELRAYLADHRARLEQSLTTGNRGFETARAYAKLYDGILSSLFNACNAAMANGRERVPMSLAAVGSYGATPSPRIATSTCGSCAARTLAPRRQWQRRCFIRCGTLG